MTGQKMGRSATTKAEWLEALEGASQLGPNQSSAIWVWFIQELGLRPEYFLAIREAVLQGGWRTAKNPRAYIKDSGKTRGIEDGPGR
jgi:hypothetical protein